MVLVRSLMLVVLSAILIAGCGGSGADKRAKAPAPQKAADPARARKLQEVLDVQRDGYGATGMAAAVIIRGRLFWSGGSGLANRETKAPVAADTPFPIFSITKMFVGALAVRLAQEGRLKLDDPLSGALPERPNADRIALRMLLNQTSGVGGDQRRLERDTEVRPRTVWTPRRTLSYARKPHAAPGEKWEYNNANYVLAGLVIEHATGRPVAEALPDWRRQLLRFVPATDAYDGYGLGVGKGQLSTGEDVWGHFGAGPGFVTSVSHLPAKAITVAVLSSGDADLGSLTQLLANAALEAG
jgi:CubicO group peptidase (beta-lactamase class C family)